MQSHTKAIYFGLFFNLNNSHLNELIFWIHRNNKNINFSETVFLFKLFGVEIFWKKNALICKITMASKIASLQKKGHLKHDNFLGK